MARSSETYEMACIFTGGETTAAVQIRDPASGEELWIPLSQVEQMHRPSSHKGEGVIVMTRWIAEKKGLL